MHVNMNNFTSNTYLPYKNQQNIRINRDISQEEASKEAQQPSEINVSGEIYKAAPVNFHSLDKNELLNEKITFQKNVNDGIVIAFDSPLKKDEVITMEISKEVYQTLKNNFSGNNFFEREDGMIRLNKEANEYVAGWYQDIAQKRGYLAADSDKDGFIKGNERKELNVGFERSFNYSFYNDKIIKANVAAEGRTYQKYGDTSDFLNEGRPEAGSSYISNQHIDFADTIEKELQNTIMQDSDFDSTITLKEGLEHKAGDADKMHENVLRETQKLHDHYLETALIKPPTNMLVNRLVDMPEIKTEAERQKELEAFKAQAANLSKTIGTLPLEIANFDGVNVERYEPKDGEESFFSAELGAGYVEKYDDGDDDTTNRYKGTYEKTTVTQGEKEPYSGPIKFPHFSPGKISIIAIEINNIEKTTEEVITDGTSISHTNLDIDYSTKAISGDKTSFTAKDHADLLDFFATIRVAGEKHTTVYA